MTSATDGRTHTITGAEFDAGVWYGHGIYRAVCGREVMAASLMSGPGPRCPDCPSVTYSDSARTERLVTALASLLPGFGSLIHGPTTTNIDDARRLRWLTS